MNAPDLTKYKKLTDIEHVRARPATYAGSAVPTTKKTWLVINGKPVEREVTYIPLFLKMFDEIISNSVDHSKRPEGKHLNKISVNIDRVLGRITVQDNGGIPVAIHPEHGVWIPDMIFGELRSGQNYDDTEERTGTGMNGLGSKLTNIFSSSFQVYTADGSKSFDRVFRDGNTARDPEAVIATKNKGTIISYTPDYDYLKMTGLDDDHISMLERRVYEIAACNPNIEVTLNGNLINLGGLAGFAKLFSEEAVYMECGTWRVAIAPSEDGFKHKSYVNSTSTMIGGQHVEYVVDKIIDGVREHIEKKTKQKVKPSDIRQHFHLFLDCTVINPTYDSQSKENLVTPPRDFGSAFAVTAKFIKQLIESPVVAAIIEWAKRRQALLDMKEIEERNEENRKSSLNHIVKYEPATSRDRSLCRLYVCEGDSAINPLVSVRDPKTQGLFPLRGKPLNVRNIKKLSDILKNKEMCDLFQILGLEIGKKADPAKLRYKHMVITTDADLDGAHIKGLLMNTFKVLWPELLQTGFLQQLNTPLKKVTVGKKKLFFRTDVDFKEWQAKSPGVKYHVTHLKGLGSNDNEDFKLFLGGAEYHESLVFDAPGLALIDMAFDPERPDDRKEWLYGESKEEI